MKNIWKGLTVGAFVGAAIGIVRDALDDVGARGARLAEKTAERARAEGGQLSDKVREELPRIVDSAKAEGAQLARRAKADFDDAREKVGDADLGERAKAALADVTDRAARLGDRAG